MFVYIMLFFSVKHCEIGNKWGNYKTKYIQINIATGETSNEKINVDYSSYPIKGTWIFRFLIEPNEGLSLFFGVWPVFLIKGEWGSRISTFSRVTYWEKGPSEAVGVGPTQIKCLFWPS